MKFQILTVALAVLGVAAADEAPKRRGLAKTGAKGTDASPLARQMAKRIKLRKAEDDDDCDDDSKKNKSKDDPADPAEGAEKKSSKDVKCSSSKDDRKSSSSSTYHSADKPDDRLHRGICVEDGVEADIEEDYCRKCDPPHEDGSFCHWLNDDKDEPPLANDPTMYVYEAYDAEDFHSQVAEILELIEAEGGGLASKTGSGGGGGGGGEKKSSKKKKKKSDGDKKSDKKKKSKKKRSKKKKSKKKRKSSDDDDDSTSSGSSDFFRDGVEYRGFRATRDMCDKPKKSRKEECKDIKKDICDKPEGHSDDLFCEFVGIDTVTFRTGLRG